MSKDRETVFIKRYPSKGELPKSDGKYWCKFKDFSDALHQQEWVLQFGGFGDNECYEYWLEEIELPSEEDMKEQIDIITKQSFDALSNHYCINTANFILNKLKGE